MNPDDMSNDTWDRYANKEVDDMDVCEGCEDVLGEDDLEEVRYMDADGDRQSMWLCEQCIDKEIWV